MNANSSRNAVVARATNKKKNMKNNVHNLLGGLLILLSIPCGGAGAGEGPAVAPNTFQVVGIDKEITLTASDGSSDEPDFDPACPPWSLIEGSTTWNWTITGNIIQNPSANSITLTGQEVGKSTAVASRNDRYQDKSQPPVTADGVPSSDSSPPVDVYTVKVKETDSHKIFYCNRPAHPTPVDLETKRYEVEGAENVPSGGFTWTATPNKLLFADDSGTGRNLKVIATSTDYSIDPDDVTITVKYRGKRSRNYDSFNPYNRQSIRCKRWWHLFSD